MKNNLRVLRATENMTQAELARQSGVSGQTINSIEAGRYIPSTVLALKIAKIFGVPVDQVFMLEQGDRITGGRLINTIFLWFSFFAENNRPNLRIFCR